MTTVMARPSTVPTGPPPPSGLGPGRSAAVVASSPDAGGVAVVVLRLDSTAPVDAEVRAGARLPWLDDLALGLFTVGANLGAAGAVGLWAARRMRG